MKLFFISDIHGSLEDLNRVIKKFEEKNSDYLIVLGDQLYHGPRNPLPVSYNPQKVSELLNKYKDKIIAIRGNCDSEVDQMLLDYPVLSDYAILLVDSKKFFLTHGHIFNNEKMPNISKGDILCYGHTHIPLAEYRDGFYFFNPGSISLPKGGYKKSYGLYEDNKFLIFDFEDNLIKKMEIDIDKNKKIKR